MPPPSTRTAQVLSAIQTIRLSQKKSRVAILLCEQAFAKWYCWWNDQSIMNMPTSILQSMRRLLSKQKIPAKFNKISTTINTMRQRYSSQYGAPTYPFLQIVIVCISAPPVPFWSCLHGKNTTSASDLQRLFDFTWKTHFKTTRRYRMYISSTSSLLVLPITQVFRIYKDCLIWT